MVLVTAWLIARLLDDPRFEERREGHRASASAEMVVAALEQGGAPFARRLLRRMQGRGAAVLVIDGAGRELLARPLPPKLGALLREEKEVSSARVAQGADGQAYRVFVAPRLGPRERDRALFYGVLHRHFIGRAPMAAALRFGVAVALSGIFCFALAWYLSRPAVRLRQATREVAEGNLGVRVAPRIGNRWDEFGDLGREFDAMVERIEALLAAQRRLLNDLSHEIRSPLARLRMAVELLRNKSGEEGAGELARIEREVERLDDLVGRILTLSRLEAGGREYRMDSVELGLLVEEVIADARFETEGEGREITLRGDQGVVVRGSAELLRRALENVVRNALRHTPPGTPVEVWLERREKPGTVRVRVMDRGPGVSAELLGRLFEPFQRGEGGGRGHGLGLAITRRAVEAHGGHVEVENRPQGGLMVTITLPGSATGVAVKR